MQSPPIALHDAEVSSRVKARLEVVKRIPSELQRARMLTNRVLNTNINAFYEEGGELNSTPLLMHYIWLKDENMTVHAKQAPLAVADRKPLMEKIRSLERKGVLERADGSPFKSPVLLLPKKEAGKSRMVNSYIKLNAASGVGVPLGVPNDEDRRLLVRNARNGAFCYTRLLGWVLSS